MPGVREYKLCLMGGGGVGKSCLGLQFTQKQFVEEYDSDFEYPPRKQTVLDDEIVILDIYELPRCWERPSMRHPGIRQSEGFLLIYSVVHRLSFEELESLYKELLHVRGDLSCPVIIVANKCDLNEDREVDTSEGQALAERWGFMYVETSAKTGLHVDDAFHELAREIRRRNPVAGSSAQQTSSGPRRDSSSPTGAARGDGAQAHKHLGGCFSGCVIT